MASCFKHDLQCPICHDVFRDPVILSCSHSFCNPCLLDWWAEKLCHQCPVCKELSTARPASNLALRNLCEAFLLREARGAAAGAEASCSLHADRLRLFCLEDRQLACLICKDSKKHLHHAFRPVDEAAQDFRAALRDALKPLKENLKGLRDVQRRWDLIAQHIGVQAAHTEKRIRECFAELHLFLTREEEARIGALKEEEERKSRRMKEEKEALSGRTAALSDAVRAAEEALGAPDVSFLMTCKASVERVQQRPPVAQPELHRGSLIDEAKHVGNLSFDIWRKMRDVITYTPVTLDPNTAGQKLALSEDLTGLRFEEKQTLPENPERTRDWSVLGSQRFDSGTHSWEVEVADVRRWMLGVTEESDGCSRRWTLCRLDREYKAFLPSDERIDLPFGKELRRVRACLDWNTGNLRFTDPDTDAHIHTFTHTFTHRLIPYFVCCDEGTLKVLPADVSVTV